MHIRRNSFSRALVSTTVLAFSLSAPLAVSRSAEEPPAPLTLSWADNYLTITGADLPGGSMRILYLEAYCRPGSTKRDWGETVIGHTTRLVSASDDGTALELEDTLRDGVVVRHKITATHDEVDFRLAAHNPTDRASEAHWAQPCIRVDKFTGCPTDDARELVPEYARKCFVFLGGKLARLPTEPWATEARYVPGQVYCPRVVDRNDVNPRPLSKLVPSNGLTGCFSADEKHMMAVAWEPYQELFLGVITCIHSDFRVGGLAPGETKEIRGKMYFVPADVESLTARYRRDFPEQAGEK